MKFHCVIISWDSFFEKSALIADAVFGHVDSLTVIYSNKNNRDESGRGKWIKVPNDWFYGRKFQVALDCLSDDEVLILIQADAVSFEWKSLIERCQDLMRANHSIGVWAPAINATPWIDERVSIANNPDLQLNFVAQTDGIVFAYNQMVLNRLKKAIYSDNNLGWGIDWLAICYSYTNDLYVVRDLAHVVGHVMGAGYSTEVASHEMNLFLQQMTLNEMIMYELLNSYINRVV